MEKDIEAVNGTANPDCEPATKAYVKCIARKLQKSSEHKHQTYLGWSIVVIGILSALALMCGAGSLTDINWTTIGFVFVLLAFVRMFEWFIGEDHNTTKSNGIADIPQIKKYEPPVCKDKKECD